MLKQTLPGQHGWFPAPQSEQVVPLHTFMPVHWPLSGRQVPFWQVWHPGQSEQHSFCAAQTVPPQDLGCVEGQPHPFPVPTSSPEQHLPLRQLPALQEPLEQQGWPMPPQATQEPFWHSRLAPQLTPVVPRQVPVLHSWQAPAQALLQQRPSTQLPDWHWVPAVQLAPLASWVRQVPPMQTRLVPPGQRLLSQQGWLLPPQGTQALSRKMVFPVHELPQPVPLQA
jgi:hypothetical protein